MWYNEEMRYLVLVVFAVFSLACSTVKNAREKQEKILENATNNVSQIDTSILKNGRLPEFIAFARANRPSFQSARLALEDAKLALKEISADAPLISQTPWQAIDASIAASYAERSPSSHHADLKASTLRSDPSASLSINLLIYDFGRNAARAQSQVETILSAEATLFEEGFSIASSVAQNYFTLLTNDALLEVAQTNRTMYAEHLHRAEQQLDQGIIQPLDVLRARLDLSNAEEKVIAASNEVDVAASQLFASLGLDATSDATWLKGAKNSLFNHVKEYDETTENASDFFNLALTNAPSMQIVQAQVRARSAQVDAAIADLMPTINANISLNWTDPLWYWRWGADVAESIFTGWKRTTAVDRAVNALERANEQLETTKHQLSCDIAIAVATRDNARKAMQSAEDSVREATKNLETIKAQFDIGSASRVDFTDAVNAYTTALGNRASAFYRGQIAEAMILKLIGKQQ